MSVPVEVRQCSRCREDKPLDKDHFHKDKRRTGGFDYICKTCARDKNRDWRARNPEKAKAQQQRRILAKYGLDEQRFRALGTVCWICKSPLSTTGKSLSIDHDHSCCPAGRSCGRCVRGLLCDLCNTGIAKFEDDPKLLRWAADYLDKFRAEKGDL